MEKSPLIDRPRGSTLIYTTIISVALFAFVSLGVDWGRVQLVKTELRRACDAAALYGALGVQNGTAVSKAQSSAAENSADGSAISIQTSDVEIGIWNTSTKTFTVTSVSPNAVRVTVSRTTARGNAVPMMFARAIGVSSVDVTAQAIAELVTPANASTSVPGYAAPFYVGKTGTMYDPWGGESATTYGPKQLTGIPVTPGAVMTFTATGTTRYSGGGSPWSGTPEGYIGSYQSQMYPNDFFVSSLNAPSQALVGVFTTDTPASTSKPAELDFSSSGAQEYSKIQPALNQTFFIGDGVNSDGSSRTVVVPANATRLYLGTNDAVAWRDNEGTLTVNATNVGRARIVK